jgi:hypothetical protein
MSIATSFPHRHREVYVYLPPGYNAAAVLLGTSAFE